MADESTLSTAPAPEASVESLEKESDKLTATVEPHSEDAVEAPSQNTQSSQNKSIQENETSETLPQPVNGSATKPNDDVSNLDAKEVAADPSGKNTLEGETLPEPTNPKTSVTPSKKSSAGSVKKRTSGVPEHRSRKLNKKKSKPALHQNAKPGALFLARMKGHQPWPSIICDEDMLPAILIQTRPITAAQADGSFKKADYAEGGRRENERSFPVMFLFTNEFAWIPNTELTPITPEECAEAAEKQKSKTLAGAYNTASEGHDLAHFKQVLLEHQEMLNAEAEAKAEREAKKAEKATKQKRKSDAIASTADKMDIDEEGKGKTKKRKKEAGADEDEKPAKTQKTGTTKLKLNMTPKTPSTEPSKKKAPKSRSATKKSNTKSAGSEEDVASKPQEEVLSPAQLQEKKEKEVRYIRHKLQKGFLSRDTVPSEDEIETMSNYLSKVEAHPDLEGSILRATKIHKVLKAMIRLDSIPKDDEYHFKKRSRELLDKWNKTLASDPGAAAEKDEENKTDSTGARQGDLDDHANNEAANVQPANATSSDEKVPGESVTESALVTQVVARPHVDDHEKNSSGEDTGDQNAPQANSPTAGELGNTEDAMDKPKTSNNPSVTTSSLEVKA